MAIWHIKTLAPALCPLMRAQYLVRSGPMRELHCDLGDGGDGLHHHVAPLGLPAGGEEGEDLLVQPGVVGRLQRQEESQELRQHLLPLLHHVPLQVAEGLLAWEGDLGQLGILAYYGLVEIEEVGVSPQYLPLGVFPVKTQG